MSDKQKNISYKLAQMKSSSDLNASSGHSDSEYLIELGTQGHFPLFFQDWIQDSFQGERKPISLSKARKEVKLTLDNLSRHKNFERKKIALSSMEKNKREVFIQSFFRVVENKILDKESTSLH